MEFQNQKAIWLQIAHQIASRISAGEWLVGERVPSVRDMAAEIQVNPNTVVRTFNYLQDEGVLANQRGIGYFVAPDGLKQAQNLRKKAFTEDVLPEFFNMMEELGLTWGEVQDLYHKRVGSGR